MKRLHTIAALTPLFVGSLATAACAPAEDEQEPSDGAESALVEADHAQVNKVLHTAIVARKFPGAVVRSEHLDTNMVYEHAYGTLEGRTALTPDAVYDLASVTKVLATTVAVMREVDSGRLSLDGKVSSYVPGLDDRFGRLTLRQLLMHQSCLPDGPPPGSINGQKSGETADVVAWFNANANALAGKGACGRGAATYSDLNMILAAAVVQSVSGKRLDRYLQDEIYDPLGMTSTRFNPPAAWKGRIAPTETYGASKDRSGRSGQIHGQVHDETSWYFGGVGGNAGLFSTAGDIGKLVRGLLKSDVIVKKPATRATFFASQGVTDQLGGKRALGWEIAPWYCPGFGPNTVGHTGFTGTSVCIDPDRNSYAVVLTNRVFPTRNGPAITGERQALSRILGEKADPCAKRPTYRGLCGNTASEGNAGLTGYLYACRDRKVTKCATRCVSAAAGTPDFCQ